MIHDDEHALAVAELFTAAALNGDWPTALNALADSCGSERAQLIGLGSATSVEFNWVTRIDASALEEFAVLHARDPMRNARVRVALGSSKLTSYHDIEGASDVELHSNFEVANFFRRHDVPHGSQVTLVRNDEMLIGLAALRGHRRGVPQAEDRLAFETLAPHVLAAVRLQIALEGQGAHLMTGALEAVQAAAFVCDGFGRIKSHTPAAEAAVRRGPLQLKAGKLTAPRAADSRALEGAIRAAVSGVVNPYTAARSTLIIRDADAPELFEVVEVAPLPRKKFGLGFEPRAVVTVRGRPNDESELSHLLRTAFGLTNSEAAVVARLAAGEARESIAEDRRVTLDTVRMQIKRAFSKMNVHREAEMVALTNRLR